MTRDGERQDHKHRLPKDRSSLAATSLSDMRMACELTSLMGMQGKPRTEVNDDSSELTSLAIPKIPPLLCWLHTEPSGSMKTHEGVRRDDNARIFAAFSIVRGYKRNRTNACGH